MENNLKPLQSLRPFTRFCCTIGNLPSSYLISMTYEEQLLWLCDYIKNTILPAINNNAEAVTELQNLYLQLKDYVDNYFTNLNIQNEINNKLDAMAEDGTLANIINQEIFNDLNTKITNKLSYYKVTPTTEENLILEYFEKIEPKIIEFETGTYNFTQRIFVNSNTTVLFNNSIINNSFLDTYGEKTSLMGYKLTDEFLGYNGNHNIKLYDGFFNFSMVFGHNENVEIKNCEFGIVGGGHCIQLMACKNFIVDSCTFNGVKITTGDYYAKECINIDPCTYPAQPYAQAESPIFDGTHNQNLKFINNTFNEGNLTQQTNYGCISSHGNDPNHDINVDNIEILNNTVNITHFAPFSIVNWQNAIISNNTSYQNNDNNLQHGGGHIFIRGNNKNIIINDNIFTGGYELIHFSILDIEHLTNKNLNVKFINNYATNITNSYGSYLFHQIQNCENCSFSNNILSKIGVTGFRFYNNNTNTIIENNKFDTLNIDSGQAFASLYGDTNTQIINNQIKINTPNTRCIRINENSHNFYIANNNYNQPNYFIIINNYANNGTFENNNAIYGLQTSLNSNNINNMDLQINITEFKEILLQIGGANFVNTISLKPWFLIKFDGTTRTYKFPLVQENNTVTYGTCILNSDNTFSYSSTLNLRALYAKD